MGFNTLVAHPATIVFEVLCNGSRPSECAMSTVAIAATTDRADPPLVLQRGLGSHRCYFDVHAGSEKFEGGRTIFLGEAENQQTHRGKMRMLNLSK